MPLLNYVHSIQNGTQFPGTWHQLSILISVGPIIFTGHSLGGAIAKIVGVKLNMTAVAFEAPGLVWSSKKFVCKLLI